MTKLDTDQTPEDDAIIRRYSIATDNVYWEADQDAYHAIRFNMEWPSKASAAQIIRSQIESALQREQSCGVRPTPGSRTTTKHTSVGALRR